MHGWQANLKRTCASPVAVRAMPENEIPPVIRGDLYFPLSRSFLILSLTCRHSAAPTKRQSIESIMMARVGNETAKLIIGSVIVRLNLIRQAATITAADRKILISPDLYDLELRLRLKILICERNFFITCILKKAFLHFTILFIALQ